MIEVRGLTKRYGATLAVDDLSFDVPPGTVTGFLGPNGAGKSTTMRLMLELDHADAGGVAFHGRRYHTFDRPLREVGSLLDASYVHPSRSARNHLRWVAASNGIDGRRVDECLGLVGLSDVGARSVGGFSLGMRQRLGLATALLGDPHTLVLDEPATGLDPEGISWVRQFLRYLAGLGRTVLVSSHLLGEMAQTADSLVVIGRGRLIAHTSVEEFIATYAADKTEVRVRSPDVGFADQLRSEGAHVTVADDGGLRVSGLDAARIGELAAAHRVVLHELAPQAASLEDAFLEVTRGHEDHVARFQPGGSPDGAAS